MNEFVISISYGNYLIQNGGTDKVIREHKEMFLNRKVDYIFLFPVVRTINIGFTSITLRYWGINKNNSFNGIYKMEGVLNYIGSLINAGGECIGFFIHHTWRIEKKELRKILDFVSVPIIYYLHDFYPICDEKNLINQDDKYCGYGLDHFDCTVNCKYHEESMKNKKELEDLVERYKERITFIAPSENTRDIFRKAFSSYNEKFISIPHQILCGKYERSGIKKPLKVAFIGKQVMLKGWEDYKTLVNSLDESNQYQFFYLGTGDEQIKKVKVKKVSVREQGLNAMLDSLRELKIDVVLLLSCWPETYSYTYFEAYAAGCFIITYKCSGNMADMVRKVGNGLVVSNISELVKLFRDSEMFYNCVKKYYDSEPYIPEQLNLNNEIVRIVAEKKIANKRCKVSVPNAKKCIFGDAIYRLQNRKKLKKIIIR